MQDYDFTKKYDDAFEKFNKDVAEVQASRGEKRSDFIIAYCTAAFEFFNSLFGEGTSQQLFGEKLNMVMCDDAVFDLAQLVVDDLKEYQKNASTKLTSIETSAAGNRATRRANKK